MRTYLVIILILSQLLFVGCAKTITETKIVYVNPEIPESILSPCDNMPLSESIMTNGDLLMAYINIQSSYIICSSKVNSIANILKSYNKVYDE